MAPISTPGLYFKLLLLLHQEMRQVPKRYPSPRSRRSAVWIPVACVGKTHGPLETRGAPVTSRFLAEASRSLLTSSAFSAADSA